MGDAFAAFRERGRWRWQREAHHENWENGPIWALMKRIRVDQLDYGSRARERLALVMLRLEHALWVLMEDHPEASANLMPFYGAATKDGGFLIEGTVGRRRIGINLESNESESGWYYVVIQPGGMASGRGDMAHLNFPWLLRLLSGAEG